MCFAWAVLSAIHPYEQNSERLSKYKPYISTIDLTGLKFQTPINQVTKFERTIPPYR